MSIEHAILGLLSWKPLTGYDLKKMFAGSAILYWSGNNNQIYKALLDLHEAGLVSLEVQMQEDSPPRKIYTITEKGMAELRRWVLSPPELPQLRHPFLIQLAWAADLPPDEMDALLARYEDEVQVQMLMFRDQEQRGNISPQGKPRDAYVNAALAQTPRQAFLWGMILRNWLSFYENELNWVRQLRTELLKGTNG
jgi:DNA-binding PadR family transcriptional regulator